MGRRTFAAGLGNRPPSVLSIGIGLPFVCDREFPMKWTTPRVVEICLGMEINCYACAEI
jgi:coenzyme PQQ precursor peptide PqqA